MIGVAVNCLVGMGLNIYPREAEISDPLATYPHTTSGADIGRGSWGLGHPPFGGPPNFIKREYNVARMCANKPRFSTYGST